MERRKITVWAVAVAVLLAAAFAVLQVATAKATGGMTALSRAEAEQWWGASPRECGKIPCTKDVCDNNGTPREPNCAPAGEGCDEEEEIGTACDQLKLKDHPGKACEAGEAEDECIEDRYRCKSYHECECRLKAVGVYECKAIHIIRDDVYEWFCFPPVE